MSLRKISAILIFIAFALSTIFGLFFSSYVDQVKIIYKSIGGLGLIIMLYDYTFNMTEKNKH